MSAELAQILKVFRLVSGQREYWWLDAAMLAFNFFLVLFGFPESKWQGMHPEKPRMMQS